MEHCEGTLNHKMIGSRLKIKESRCEMTGSRRKVIGARARGKILGSSRKIRDEHKVGILEARNSVL